MRGEKRECIRWTYELWGSPPHARGKDTSYHYGRSCAGITPACAGKSEPDIQKVNLVEDHPRMRGEKFSPICHIVRLLGSPPHARGKVPPYS